MFNFRVWVSDSDPHVCKASNFLTEQPLKPAFLVCTLHIGAEKGQTQGLLSLLLPALCLTLTSTDTPPSWTDSIVAASKSYHQGKESFC